MNYARRDLYGGCPVMGIPTAIELRHSRAPGFRGRALSVRADHGIARGTSFLILRSRTNQPPSHGPHPADVSETRG